jgi:phosphoribosylanthranilate isomerase
MTRVKICGLKQPGHALAAAEEGADYIGLNFFADSPRWASMEQARAIIAAVRSLGGSPQVVGLFVNTPAGEVNDAAKTLGLDMVQLSGAEPIEYIDEIELPVIKVIHVPGELELRVAVVSVGRSLSELRTSRALPMLDAKVAGKFGGTGESVDVAVVRNLSPSHDFLLAGGLRPETVAETVREVRPWGVDVSSGVETDGEKDEAKIRAFIRAVHKADE